MISCCVYEVRVYCLLFTSMNCKVMWFNKGSCVFMLLKNESQQFLRQTEEHKFSPQYVLAYKENLFFLMKFMAHEAKEDLCEKFLFLAWQQ